MVTRLVPILFSLTFFFSCSSPSFQNKEDVWKYVREPSNGVIHKKKVDDYTLAVYYKPKALLILQELENNDSSRQLAELESKYRDYDYFVLELEKSDGAPLYDNENSNFSELLRIIAYQFQQYTFITTDSNKKIFPVDLSYFPTYTLRNKIELLLIFKNDQYHSADKLNLHVKEFGFGIGDQAFEFDTKKIKNIPDFDWTNYP